MSWTLALGIHYMLLQADNIEPFRAVVSLQHRCINAEQEKKWSPNERFDYFPGMDIRRHETLTPVLSNVFEKVCGTWEAYCLRM